ncbi:MAG: response regulator [Spirochaetaceae bacterium]|nr:MAG: response regulator [Spirochaetaceae bacterium]
MEIHADVLLVDDNAINQLVAQQILKKAGYTCEVVSSGEEAISRLGRERYRLILMDVQMPGLDGIETTRRIRSFPDEQPNADVPIIAMTAYTTAEDRESCKSAGMNDYMTKPLQLDHFLTTVREHLDGSGPSASGNQEDTPDDQDEHRPASFDLDDALARTGRDRELIERTVTMFLNSAAERVRSIAAACAREDFQKARDLAHNLHGAALNVSARNLARIATRIEQASRAGDCIQATDAVGDLEHELERVRTAVKDSGLLQT